MGENLNLFPDDLLSSKLLLDESPLQLLPSLACAIGLKEAIVLQQLHWKLRDKARRKVPMKMGRHWIYNTYEVWQREEFPFLTVFDVERIFQRLEKGYTHNGREIKPLIASEQFEKRDRNRRKWYSVNYKALKDLEKEMSETAPDGSKLLSSDGSKMLPSEGSNLPDSEGSNLPDSEGSKMLPSDGSKLLPSNTTKNFNKDLPKDTHTQESAAGVSVFPKFTIPEYAEYLSRCIAEGQLIHSPDALMSKLLTGASDGQVEFKLYPERFEQTQREKFGEPRKFTSEPCTVCFGAKFETVPGKGARPCPHCVDERGARRGLEPCKSLDP